MFLEARVSAEDFLPEYSFQAGADDPYDTRSLPIQELVQPPSEMPAERLSSSSRKLPQPPQRSRGHLLLNLILWPIALVMVGIAGGLYYLDRGYEGKIYPNVSIQGISVGNMTPQEAEAALQARYAAFLKQPATLTFGDQVWKPTATDLGIHFDFSGAVDAAYNTGRNNGLIDNAQEVIAIWQNGYELPLHTSFDQNAIQRYVRNVSANLERKPINAGLSLNDDGVNTTPMQIGRQVLVDQTVQEITDKLSTFTPQTVAIRTRDLQPRLHDADVAAAKQKIEAMLQGPLTLNVQKQQYTWSPEQIRYMLDIAEVPKDSDGDQISVDLNPYQVNRRIVKIGDDIGRGSVNPRVAWNGGNLRIIRPGKAGLRLDEDGTRQLILNSIGTSQRTLDLPVQEIQPQVNESNLNTLGIKELIAVGRSDFSGSAAYRINNIGVGMNILNGILLAPGEEFSFNKNVGSIDAKNGFVEGYAIIQNRTQLEFGGGICQDSTTMFRAAFWAGLPITERWGHSFYISWYDKYGLEQYGNGPGLDATIFTGGPDLKFTNDTGHWLLIQTSSDPSTVTARVAIYGTKPNRTVSLTHRIYNRVPAPSTPKYLIDRSLPPGSRRQTDTARGGMTIDVYRTITENGVRKSPELFRTVFKAWPNIYLINPAPKPPPQPTPAPTDPAAPPAPADAAAPATPAPAPATPATN